MLAAIGGDHKPTVPDQSCIQSHPSFSIHFDMPRYDSNENNSFDLDQKNFTHLISQEDVLKAYRLNIKSCALKVHLCKYVTLNDVNL